MKIQTLSSKLLRSVGMVAAASLLAGFAVATPTSASAAPSSEPSASVAPTPEAAPTDDPVFSSSSVAYPYSIGASADRTTFYTDDPTPIIKVDPGTIPPSMIGYQTDNLFYLVDLDAQKLVNYSSDLAYDFKIDRFFSEKEKHFKVIFAQKGQLGKGLIATVGIQAESGEIAISRGGWEVLASGPKDHIGERIELGFSTNQFLRRSWVSNPEAIMYYGAYVRNLTTGSITQAILPDQDSLTGYFPKLDPLKESETGRYQIYVAKKLEGVTSLEQLEEIQAKSNVLVVPPRPWGVAITSAVLDTSPWSAETIVLNTKLTRSVRASESKQAYVENADNGEIVHYGYQSWDYAYDQPLHVAGPEGAKNFVIHIADKGQTPRMASELKNIVASSNGTYPITSEGDGDYLSSERFQNGSNPATADCQQQCYGDPVNSLNGELFENDSDLQLEGAIGLNFIRSYSSLRSAESGPFGHGTTFSYNMGIRGDRPSLESSVQLSVRQENGSTVSFSSREEEGKRLYSALPGFRATLETDADGSYIFTRTQNQDRFVFSSSGALTEITDRLGNAVSLSYTNGKLSAISNGTSTISVSWSGDLISSVTDGSQTIDYSYSDGNLTEVVDSRLSAHKRYSYYSDNRIRTIAHPNGGVYETDYDEQGRVSSQKNPRGGVTGFSYGRDSRGLSTTQVTLPGGGKTMEAYDSAGRLNRRIFAQGTSDEKSYSYSYTNAGELSTETLASGKTIQYRYDARGNLIYISSLGAIYRFEYNERNQLTKTINPAGKSSTNEYDTAGVLLKSVGYSGKVTSFDHNSKGMLTGLKDPNGQKSGLSSSYSYNGSNLLRSTTDTRGKITDYGYDSARNPVKITDPLGNETEFSYFLDNPDLISKISYENGSEEGFSYDGAGRKISAVAKDGTETEYSYDSMDNLLAVTDAHGTMSYEYDADQKLISTTNPKGAKTSYEYNGLGLLTKETLPGGQSILKEYNSDSMLSAEIDAAGNRTTYSYDGRGRLETVTDPAGGVTRMSYDSLGNVTQRLSPSGNWINYSYNAVGQITAVDEKGLRKTAYGYDDSGNLTKTTYGDGTTELRSYDSEGNLEGVTDRKGKLTAYSYDALNRTSKETRVDSSEVKYSYDSAGNLLSTDYGDGYVYENSYNLKDQLLKSKTPEGLTTEYGYSPSGELISRGPPQAKVSYSYNSYGEISSVKYPSGRAVDYSYDSLGSLREVKSVGEVLASYSYDDRLNLTGSSYGNGTREDTEFDALSRAKKITVGNSGGELYSRSLEFNADSQISKASSSFGGAVKQKKSYKYSPLGTMGSATDELSAKIESYSYDPLNNLRRIGAVIYGYPTGSSQVASSTSSSGQISESKNYKYDTRGNRTESAARSVFEDAISYSWSKSDRLKQAVVTASSRQSIVNYEYDADGLLTTRKGGSPKADSFSWDAVSGSIPVLIEDSSFEYIYGAESTPFLQIEKSTGKRTYLHGDERNSVVLATAADGSALWNRTYDEYGAKFTQTTAPGVVGAAQTRFAYAGEYLDPDTKLYNLRARWYDPSTASFLSVDPAVLVTGEAYSYGSGNPLSNTDPLGLWSMKDTVTSVAAAVDGFIGFPVAASISNAISPGSVDQCSTLYKSVGAVAMVGSFLVPGFGVLKGAGLAAKGVGLASKSLGKVAERAATNESGFIFIGSARASKWQVGDSIIAATARGTDPRWGTIRSRYWKNESIAASKANGSLTAEQMKRNGLKGINDNWTVGWGSDDIARMSKGRAPQRQHPQNLLRKESMELSHEVVPQRDATSVNDLGNVIQRWPQEHAAIDPKRNVSSTYPW